MKKTGILEEDAYIYSHNNDETEKDKWKKLDRKQKLQYFNDYYKNKTIIILILLAIFISLAYSMLSPKPETVVSIAVINDYLNVEKTETFSEELAEKIGLEEGKQNIAIDASFFFEETAGAMMDMVSAQKLLARLTAGDINVIISDMKKFEELKADGTFLKISEVLGREVETVSDGYGILLSNNGILEALGSGRNESVLAVVANAKEEDFNYIDKVITHLLQNP